MKRAIVFAGALAVGVIGGAGQALAQELPTTLPATPGAVAGDDTQQPTGPGTSVRAGGAARPSQTPVGGVAAGAGGAAASGTDATPYVLAAIGAGLAGGSVVVARRRRTA